jgi:hypothetical protein
LSDRGLPPQLKQLWEGVACLFRARLIVLSTEDHCSNQFSPWVWKKKLRRDIFTILKNRCNMQLCIVGACPSCQLGLYRNLQVSWLISGQVTEEVRPYSQCRNKLFQTRFWRGKHRGRCLWFRSLSFILYFVTAA